MERAVTISLSLSEFKQFLKEVLQEQNLIPKELNEEDETLNQKEAAEFLGVSQTTIIKWKKDGKVPYQQIEGSSRIRYYKSQLRKVVQKNPHLLQAARS
ncbi:helix-turn-helix domain-containing protein [Marinoscillum sp.]|uniref:helix-turn-helix domain-containing protein n=1 Tax=Marinoscillum sp. TaxID=2024838 RepID=UPI003BAC88A3